MLERLLIALLGQPNVEEHGWILWDSIMSAVVGFAMAWLLFCVGIALLAWAARRLNLIGDADA